MSLFGESLPIYQLVRPWTRWAPVVTVVHDDIDASISDVNNSNEYFPSYLHYID